MYTYLTSKEVGAFLHHEDRAVIHLAQDLQSTASELLLARMQKYGRLILKNEMDPELAFMLWRAVTEGARILSEDEVNELQRLAETADGWWRTDGEMPEFVELTQWKVDYALGPVR